MLRRGRGQELEGASPCDQRPARVSLALEAFGIGRESFQLGGVREPAAGRAGEEARRDLGAAVATQREGGAIGRGLLERAHVVGDAARRWGPLVESGTR